jgi:hypothetical protein
VTTDQLWTLVKAVWFGLGTLMLLGGLWNLVLQANRMAQAMEAMNLVVQQWAAAWRPTPTMQPATAVNIQEPAVKIQKPDWIDGPGGKGKHCPHCGSTDRRYDGGREGCDACGLWLKW